jgi:hypothetical protein
MKETEFPSVDRSGFKPNFTKNGSQDHIDIGFGEGRCSDGRPFRVEAWASMQISFITCYFSAVGIENYSNSDLKEYLTSEHVIEFKDEEFALSGFRGINVDGRKRLDASSNEMWEVTVIVGDEDCTYIDRSPRLQTYKRRVKTQSDTFKNATLVGTSV